MPNEIPMTLLDYRRPLHAGAQGLGILSSVANSGDFPGEFVLTGSSRNSL